MSKTEERVLVQGTVTFTVNCNDLVGLVSPEIAKDQPRLKAWLEDQAFKMIESSSADVEIDHSRIVTINADTADKLTNEIINHDDWKKCIQEDVDNSI